MNFNSRLLSENPSSRVSDFLAGLEDMESKEISHLKDEASTDSSVDIPTPTHSTRSDETITRDFNKAEEVVPWAGKKFIIREKGTDLVITLVGGKLQVRQDIALEDGGFQWECVENHGWLGFHNVVSGTYIGHDSRGSFIADAKQHLQWESFCARRHPKGGYILMTRHNKVLLQMAIRPDMTLFESKNEGARWEFSEVSDLLPFSLFPMH